MNPDDYAKNTSEHAQQVALFMWAALERARFPMLDTMFAIPNGGQRGDGSSKGAMIAGGKLKAEGVKTGTSDIFLPYAAKGCHGLFIELKQADWKEPYWDNGINQTAMFARAKAGRKPTAHEIEQKEFIDKMRAAGYGALFAAGFHAARQTLEGYLT